MHARVYRKEGQFVLEDLKSRNGTFIHVLGSAKVSSGDVLLAGQVLFRVVDHIGG
jgi:pSer/pThr/pTyr-binding forkhead associated (FHA) protein